MFNVNRKNRRLRRRMEKGTAVIRLGFKSTHIGSFLDV